MTERSTKDTPRSFCGAKSCLHMCKTALHGGSGRLIRQGRLINLQTSAFRQLNPKFID